MWQSVAFIWCYPFSRKSLKGSSGLSTALIPCNLPSYVVKDFPFLSHQQNIHWNLNSRKQMVNKIKTWPFALDIPPRITQNKLTVWSKTQICKKNKAEISASRLQQRKLLEENVKISLYRDHHIWTSLSYSLLKMTLAPVVISINGLTTSLNIEHKPNKSCSFLCEWDDTVGLWSSYYERKVWSKEVSWSRN